jgi:DNA-binding NtrC family response regulator
MTNVLVVDEAADDFSASLNGIAKRERQDVRFMPITTIRHLFDELTKAVPDLIILHHHWEGLSISQVLERITQLADSTRVIVFTGQSLDANDLIECARSGVADYWPKRGELEPTTVSNQIAFYCSGPEWTIKKLLMPSGAQRQLIREAAASQAQLVKVSRENGEMRDKIEALENQDSLGFRKLTIKMVTFGFNCAVLTAVFFVLSIKATALPVWANLSFVGILALFFLFLEGKISEILVKWKGGSAQVK